MTIIPFRWLFLVTFGLFLYGRCIAYFYRGKNVIPRIDYFQIINVADHTRAVKVAFYTCLALYVGLLIIPGSAGVMLQFLLPLTLLLSPFAYLREERYGFIRTFYYMFRPRAGVPIPPSQVILADVLTSYAKVLADWQVIFICALMSRYQSTWHCAPSLFSVALVFIPAIIRIRQCWHDLRFAEKGGGMIMIILNIIKYASSFPVLYLSHLVLFGRQGSGKLWWMGVNGLNFTLSSLWDVWMDWQIQDGKKLKENAVAVLLNTLVRGIWMVQMVTQANIDEMSAGLEIMRRFLWLLKRVQAMQPIKHDKNDKNEKATLI